MLFFVEYGEVALSKRRRLLWKCNGAAFLITCGILAGACDRQEKQAEAPVRPVRVITVTEQQAGRQ